jgi:hypothetical protein
MGHTTQTIHGKMNPRMDAAIPERRPVTEEISGVIERVKLAILLLETSSTSSQSACDKWQQRV